jgi:hypothetical protein
VAAFTQEELPLLIPARPNPELRRRRLVLVRFPVRLELAESEISMARERKQLGGGGLLEKKEDIAIVVERLFSNLNEATLEHEPANK